MFVVVERVIASVLSRTYESKCGGYTIPMILYCVVVSMLLYICQLQEI